MKKKTSKVIHTLKTASVQGASVDDGQHANYCLEVTISLGNLSSKMLALLSTVPETSSVEGASVDDSQHACVLSQRHHQSKEPRQTTATTQVCRPGAPTVYGALAANSQHVCLPSRTIISLESRGSTKLAHLSTVPETSSVQGASVKKKKKTRTCTVVETPSVRQSRQQTASTHVHRQ